MTTYLPVVKLEVSASLQRELMDKFDAPYMREQLEILKKENPAVYLWIKRYSKTTKDRMGSMFCGLVVYKMLKSQAEANRMAEEINLG